MLVVLLQAFSPQSDFVVGIVLKTFQSNFYFKKLKAHNVVQKSLRCTDTGTIIIKHRLFKIKKTIFFAEMIFSYEQRKKFTLQCCVFIKHKKIPRNRAMNRKKPIRLHKTQEC